MRDVIAAGICMVALASCATPRAMPAASHPANASAPTGRLAGPPPSLRAGVVDYKDVPLLRKDEPTPQHHHHGS